ncbi:nitrate- and nitrite sensing domain-containing protein [Kutzneria sp. NPDC052558]|uniref:sensor histidine kinase n=1 Tax=Kutzneria sp. NPDC052558 TaxID=3364121 RepID=UPI0037C572BA
MLIVPTLAMLTLGALRLSGQLQDAAQLGKVQRALAVNAAATKAVDDLQRERSAVISYLASDRKDGLAALAPTFTAVDNDVSAFTDTVNAPDIMDESVSTSARKGLEALGGLGPLRNSAQSTQYPDSAAFTAYTQIIGVLLQACRVAASGVSDPQIGPVAGAAQALNDAKEQLAQQNSLLMSAAEHRAFPPGGEDSMRSARSGFDSALTDFETIAGPDDRQFFADTVSGPPVDERNRLVNLSLVQADADRPVEIAAADVGPIADQTDKLVLQVMTRLSDRSAADAADLADTARQAAFRDGALVLAALLAALALMTLVAGSILAPLRVLRENALDMARVRLPEAIRKILTTADPIAAATDAVPPVPVHTTEEVGQLARAFDVVNQQAVRLAAEQAALRGTINDMFVNLSRRIQGLVERQLGVIDKLEKDEEDPDQLAHLFELDHLATQMRRNSENLLVLSGTGLVRRMARSVPVSDVLGAAVSEVEKYARVQVVRAPDLAVQGTIVNDLVHLVAELLDNATAFSAPSTKVAVRSARNREGELAIEIRDVGVGMKEHEVARANERLSNPPDVDVAVSRQMGLYVVARLAKRHHIKVRLRNNDDIDGGTTAHVLVPKNLVLELEVGADTVIETASLAAGRPSARPALTAPPASADLFAERPGKKQTADAAGDYEPPALRPGKAAKPPTPRLEQTEELELPRWFRPAEGSEPLGEKATLPGRTPAKPAKEFGPGRPRDVDARPRAVADWESAGDSGWQAAKAAVTTTADDDVTSAGLPKRVPKARLLPGSAAPRPQKQQAVSHGGQRRSADHTRSRLSTYQHGVQVGRKSDADMLSGELPVLPAGTGKEEQE